MFEVNSRDGLSQEACAPSLRPPEAMVSLDIERARVEGMLKHAQGGFVELALAAAAAFHQANPKSQKRIARSDYEGALNIAASAISRLVPVYSSENHRREQVTVSVDITRARFANGAKELRSLEGWSVARLSIRRSDLPSALPLIGRAGLQFD